LADELGISLSLDEYTKQLRELMQIHFPEAELMPGTLQVSSHICQAESSDVISGLF